MYPLLPLMYFTPKVERKELIRLRIWPLKRRIFVLSDGKQFLYRAGNFDVDPQGYLVSASGLKVQGWTNRNADGEIITMGQPMSLI